MGGIDVTELAPGTVLLDKYKVIDTIGVGGMGVVIAAQHMQLDTRVAIKFMLPQLVSNEQIVKRFIQEARAATRINSDYVARVIDVGEMTGEDLPEDGLPYMVMEYLQGKDLSEWVKTGKRFSPVEAIGFVVQAAEALAQAHKMGIVHRDVKPANLFLAERDDAPPRVKVLDFGISKLVSEHPSEMGLTKTTAVLGSGLYMSPEQMRSAKNVDHRTDVYALGICLFELLTSTQPFTAETFSELCVKVNIDPPTPLRKYRPDIPQDLAAVIAKAYARETHDRYQTMGDFVSALAPYAAAPSHSVISSIQGLTQPDVGTRSPVPPAAQPPTPPAELAQTPGAVTATADSQRKPKGAATTAIVLSIVALLGAGGAAIVYVQTQNDGPAAVSPEPEQPTSKSTDTPPALVDASPGEQPTDAGSDDATDAAATVTTPPVPGPPVAGPPVAGPPTTATVKPTATVTSTATTQPTATAPPTTTATKPCFKKDPKTGINLPCSLVGGN